MAFAEGCIAFRKGFDANFADTVNVPERVDVIHPFLASVRADGTGKEFVYSRISLIKESNEIVFDSCFLLHEKCCLCIKDFQLRANIVHASILTEF